MAEHKGYLVGIGAVTLSSDFKILLMKKINPESNLHMKWVTPGGKVEHNETLEEAIIREMKEETNLPVFGSTYVNYRERVRKTGEKYIIFFMLCFPETKNVYCDALGVHNNEPTKCEELKWFTLLEILNFDPNECPDKEEIIELLRKAKVIQ